MPPADSPLVPDPPPPRPVRRDAAIEAALRRFDGGEEEVPGPAPVRPRPTWRARPQFALAMTACLVAVIGLPAAFIVIRDGNSPVFQASPPRPSAVSRRENRTQDITAPAVPSAEPPVASAVPSPTTAVPPAQRQDNEVTVATKEPADELAAAGSAAMQYAAPPPPPPPPAAPMLAQKSAAEGVASGIVVTGSRIPQPNRETNRSAERAEAADAQTAPDWVAKDRAYPAFLTQLQTAVRKDDRGAVIKLIALPLRVNSNGKSQVYRNAASVRADFDEIFTPQVRQAILNQKFNRLFGRDQGLMIGDGQVWFDHTCPNAHCSPPGPVRITAINR